MRPLRSEGALTVWIDDMHVYPVGQFRNMKMSHMIADDEAELHRMAQAIGVKRKWYQGDHYDVALAKRAQAVRLGAVEITYRECGIMAYFQRRWGFWPRLEEVPTIEAEMRAEVRRRYETPTVAV